MTLILGHQDVLDLLPMELAIETRATTLVALSRGEAQNPLRSVLPLEGGRGALGFMPAVMPDTGPLGAKIISVFPSNVATRYPSHQGAVLLFDPMTGRLLAVVDAGAVTEIRTGAVSAVATRVLSRGDAKRLALLGSGTQASIHLDALTKVRPIRQVRIWSRTRAHAERFLERERVRHPHLSLAIFPSPEEAVSGADLITTVTGSRTPILKGLWLEPGVHVNAVGASLPGFQELDEQAVMKSRYFCDQKAAVWAGADELRLLLDAGRLREDHLLGEVGEVLSEKVTGRTSPDDITVFRSMGLAAEDVAAASLVYERALLAGRGHLVPFGGLRRS